MGFSKTCWIRGCQSHKKRYVKNPLRENPSGVICLLRWHHIYNYKMVRNKEISGQIAAIIPRPEWSEHFLCDSLKKSPSSKRWPTGGQGRDAILPRKFAPLVLQIPLASSISGISGISACFFARDESGNLIAEGSFASVEAHWLENLVRKKPKKDIMGI